MAITSMRTISEGRIKRFLSSLFFSVAFIWVAVVFFEVDTEVVYVLFVLSLMMVGGAMAAGLMISPMIKRVRRRKTEHLLTQLHRSSQNSSGENPPAEIKD